MRFLLEIILEGGDLSAMQKSMEEQGFTETDMPVWTDTRATGDLVWLFALVPDGFPE